MNLRSKVCKVIGSILNAPKYPMVDEFSEAAERIARRAHRMADHAEDPFGELLKNMQGAPQSKEEGSRKCRRN